MAKIFDLRTRTIQTRHAWDAQCEGCAHAWTAPTIGCCPRCGSERTVKLRPRYFDHVRS